MKSCFILIFCAALFGFGGCTLVEKAGRALDGSAFKEKKIAAYRAASLGLEVTEVQNKEGGKALVFSMTELPMMKIRGSAPGENGEFFLTSLEYLGGNINGWNEYSMDILGEGTLANSVLELRGEIEKIEISSGRIHKNDTRIVGNEAVTALRNRRERVDVLVEWMKSLENSPKGLSIKDFEKYWKPVMFPETVNKKKKPENWLREGDVFKRADDINWNTSYTERVFPEVLHPVRNSGTMLRDWEEALSWIYMEYEWDIVTRAFSQEIGLQ